MVAKVVSLLGSGALYGVVFLVGSVGVGATVLTLRGLSAVPRGRADPADPGAEPARPRALGA